MNLVQRTHDLAAALDALPLPANISHVYAPLTYMREAHERWLSRFTRTEVSVGGHMYVGPFSAGVDPRPYLILGMNPGPWGMVQTGVPFGDVVNARTILGSLTDAAYYPTAESLAARGVTLHPSRPITGFACKRREDSGERLWGGLGEVFRPSAPTQGCAAEHRQSRHELYADRDTTICRACGEKWVGGIDRAPQIEAVLAQCFAMNYCPLAYFAGPKGENVTPDAFSKSGPYRDPGYVERLNAACTSYLRDVVAAMQTRVVLAVGRYAESKAKIVAALAPADARPKVVYLTHPSPLATHSAQEWAEMAQRAMSEAGVLPSGGTR